MNQQSITNSATAEINHSTESTLHFARLMRPDEVSKATQNHPGQVQEAIAGRWMLCGDVSSEMFQLLKSAPPELFPTRLTAFRSSNGNGYGALTHQIENHQHRFIFGLGDPAVVEFLQSSATDKLSFMLGDDDRESALVLESPLKPVEFLPVSAMCFEMSKDEQVKALFELPFVVEAMSHPLKVPSLFDGQFVTEVSVSLLLPSSLDYLARAHGRNTFRQ